MNWTDRVTEWAAARNLIEGSDSKSQFVKLVEELGELSTGLQKRNTELILDSIGDCAVVLCIIAAQEGLRFDACLESAWEEIKERKGKMVNGVFVKEG